MKKILIALAGAAVVSSCSLYQKYPGSSPLNGETTTLEGIMGNVAHDDGGAVAHDGGGAVAATDTASLGSIGWRQLFADTLLQRLIERAWANNTDVRTAQLTIEQAQNDLASARLGHLPTLSFEPTGALNHFDGTTLRIYDIPVKASWQVSIFGQATSRKRQAEARKQATVDYRQAVMVSLAANVASTYYSLVMCDHELAILRQTLGVWEESLESMRTLYEAGLYQSPAVYRMEASLASVKSGIVELESNILTTEAALCRLLSEPPHTIARSAFGAFQMPQQLSVGIPVQLLQARPDVRQAARNMEIAYYDTQQARQDFYPNLTISGTLGWSNGQGLVNPAQFLAEAVASLTQPLFAQGKIKARYRNAQAEQEKMRLQFVQTLLNAGNEVYRYLHECHKAQRKAAYIADCVRALNESYLATRELMNHGTNTYLEVLTAQEDLLQAQITEVQNSDDGIQALINLYTALGGF